MSSMRPKPFVYSPTLVLSFELSSVSYANSLSVVTII